MITRFLSVALACSAPLWATAGELTGQQAEAMLHTIKKKATAKKVQAKGKKAPDFQAMGEKIEAALKAGELTKEEAKAKWPSS